MPGVLDPVTRPIHLVQRGVTSAGYVGALLGLEVAARVGGAVAATRSTGRATVEHRPRLAHMRGAVEGIFGSHVEEHAAALVRPMRLRHENRDIEVTPEALLEAYGSASPRLVVFLHGLAETESAWRYRSRRWYGRPGVTYGARLQAELGYVPLYVHFNSGLRISENGASLGHLMSDVVAAWPVPVTDIVLVGHSMGGLIIDSALAQHAAGWAELVSSTITLGAPRDGAPLERAANALAASAERIPHTAWLSHLLDARSDGIRDLRHGNVRRGDWEGHHRDDPVDRRTGGGLSHGPHHYAVLATLSSSVGEKLAERLGDGLVPAVAPGHFVTGSAQNTTVVLSGLNHFDVLNHPRVYRQLRDWLAASLPEGAVPAPAETYGEPAAEAVGRQAADGARLPIVEPAPTAHQRED